MIKDLERLEMKRIFLNIIKAIYAKLIATIVLNGEILEIFYILVNTKFYQYTKIRYENMLYNFTTPIHYCA